MVSGVLEVRLHNFAFYILFFNFTIGLPSAVVLTIALDVVVPTILKAKSKRIAGLLLVFFMALAFCWFAVGYGQLINLNE